MPVLFVFIILPLIEIALFVVIGGAIGLWATLAVVIGSALLGGWILRRQGAVAMRDMQRAMAEFRDPTAPLAHGALVMMAGMLLILPGFLTDTLGLLLLIPPVRTLVLRGMGRQVRVRRAGFGLPPEPAPHRYGRGAVIDGDYVDSSDALPEDLPRVPSDGPRRPSGWTRGPEAH